MANKTNAPNIFIVLELDPDKPWNEADFKRQLQKKQREWSRLVNLPTKKGLAARRNLGSISELKKIATNETRRQAQAKEARKLTAGAKRNKLEQFEEELQLLQAKGHILEAEFNRLVKEFADILSQKDIRKRLKVPVKTEKRTTKASQPALDPAKAKDIQRKLQSLGMADLYEFVGMGPETEIRLLLRQAKSLYDGVQKKAAKTPDDTLTSELSGYCLDIFKSEAERAKYDETLRLQEYEILKKKVDLVATISKKIDAKQMKQLLREAKSKKLNPVEAQAIILQHAAKKGYAVFVSEQTTHTVDALRLCGYCRALNDANRKYCTSCGQALQEPCPNCGKKVESSDMACGGCGFPTGNRGWVRVLLNDAEQARQNRQYEAASRCLEQARQAWPAVGSNTLTTKMAELEARMASDKKAQEAFLAKIEAAIRQKQFYSARSLLPPVGSSQVNHYRRQIESKIRQVESKVAQARRVRGTNPEEMVRICLEILEISQDCEPARDMLAKTPPSPPAALRFAISGKVVYLTWQPSPSQDVRYTIVRKKHSRPTSANDGQKQATVNGTVYDDSKVEIGVPLFYAVFADRAGISSKNGAILPRPVMMFQEVQNVRTQVEDRQVQLRWTPPPNVCQVLVMRSMRGYPRSHRDGQRVPTLSHAQATDSQLQNGRRYFYTIFSQFKDYKGNLQTTTGVQVEAIPQQPPTPVNKLDISVSGPSHNRQIQISWTAPAKGEVVILKSSQPYTLEPGTIIAQQELRKYGQVLTTTTNQLKERVNQLGFYYFLPVVVFQGMGYVGQAHKYICVDDVSDLSVQNLGYALRLQWEWPPNCQKVLVAFSYQGWPTLDQADTTTIPLMRAQYDLYGYYDIANPVQADHYITVFAVISQGGQTIKAAGANKGARKRVSLMSRITLAYEIKKKSWFNKTLILQIKIKGQGTIPKLLLTRKQATSPLNKFDGEIILQLESMTIEQEHIIFELPKEAKQRQSYGKLFLDNDDLYDRVTIQHPSPQKLRLF